MKLKLALFLFVAVFSSTASAQTVRVTGKKVTYTRRKPQMDFKKTFTINYPKVRASSPGLSQKIERAASYESVLGLNLKEELGEYQWLEEADYEVKYNKNGLLCLSLWMEGSAAYPSSTTKVVVVDTRTGVKVRPTDVFTNLAGLAAMVRRDQLKEIKESIAEIKKEEPDESDPASLFTDSNFKPKDIEGFEVGDKWVTFHYNYGFPHVIMALEPSGDFTYTWAQMRPYLKKGGLLSRIAR
ncbi:MAG TPA: hypothetical protein VGO43_09760 [Pyrinomonadaceae bacterium]|jgi:hypothetical protein|nr:hypothetical protein [Pyrinomonadaceae bacterium]